MGRYNEIKTVEELDKAHRQLRRALDKKGRELESNIADIRESLRPVNLFATGVRSCSSEIPFDRILLRAVRSLKHKLLQW